MVVELCRLARDAKLTTVSINGDEKSVLNNAVAIKTGKNAATFVEITAWGTTAETMAKYFKKGDELLIKGELRNKKSKIEGKEITAVFILVYGFEFTYGNKRETQAGSETAGEVLPFD